MDNDDEILITKNCPLSIVHCQFSSVDIRVITTGDELNAYDAWVRSHPHGSLWQSHAWKKYNEACGREVRVYGTNGKWKMENGKFDATALVVIDRTTGGFSTWEIARGPLWSDQRSAVRGPEALRPEWAISDQQVGNLIERIVTDAQKDRCIALYFSPPIELPATSYQLPATSRHVHPTATRIIDLTQSEEQILARMHPKGRYNINVAKRHGIDVVQGSTKDIDDFYSMLQATASRDGFIVAQKSHYARFLSDLEGSFILMAIHDHKPVAGLLGVMWQNKGIYYYGASSYEDRQLMAPYLLQWEEMRLCKKAGCVTYDLLGIEQSEKRSAISDQRSTFDNKTNCHRDPWAGISEFKRKFGGTVVTYPPEQAIVLRPWMNRALQLKRTLFG